MVAAAAVAMNAINNNRSDSPEPQEATASAPAPGKQRPPAHCPGSFKEFFKGGWEGTPPFMLPLRTWYEQSYVQWAVASIIVLNFAATILEKEIDPAERAFQVWPQLWTALDVAFTSAFVVELFINIYANWLMRFWRSW